MNIRTKKMSCSHLTKVLKLALPNMLYVSARWRVAARVQSTSTAEKNKLKYNLWTAHSWSLNGSQITTALRVLYISSEIFHFGFKHLGTFSGSVWQELETRNRVTPCSDFWRRSKLQDVMWTDLFLRLYSTLVVIHIFKASITTWTRVLCC